MPKNIDLSSSNLKFYYEKLIKNFGWVFLIALLAIVFFEFFEINASAQIILNLNQSPPAVNQSKVERINFDAYGQIINRINAAQNFQATEGVTNNPFVLSTTPAATATATPAQGTK